MNLRPWSREISSQTHYLLIGDRVEALAWPARQAYVLVSRGDCHFFKVDVTNVPAAARQPYIERQVQKNSPWSGAGHYVAGVESGQAAIWMWDANWIEEVRAGLPATMKAARCLPEAALLPAGSEGPAVHACTEGVDYQVWRAGCLVESRWSPDELNPGEAALFQRGTRVVSDLPEPGNGPDWQAGPWTEAAMDWRAMIRDERALMLGGAALLVFTVCLQLGMIAAFALKTGAAQRNVLDLQEVLGEKLQYRLEAERIRTVTEQWSQFLPKYTQLEVVAEFTRLLEGQVFQLVEWEYQEGGVRVTLKNPDLDSRETVSRLESGTFFTDVRIEPGQGQGEHNITLNINQAGP